MYSITSDPEVYESAPCIDKWFIYDLPTAQDYPDPTIFQMEKRNRISQAVVICQQCPVLKRCAQEAISQKDLGVIRAGRPLENHGSLRSLSRDIVML